MKVKVKSFSHVWHFATPRTVAHQTPPSMGFSRQEYWSGLPFPSPGDLPNPGIEPRSPALQADALTSEPPGKPLYQCIWKSYFVGTNFRNDNVHCLAFYLVFCSAFNLDCCCCWKPTLKLTSLLLGYISLFYFFKRNQFYNTYFSMFLFSHSPQIS